MRYVILLILWIITACLSHLQHSNLLSGDPGMVGEYIGSVFLGPLLLPVLVSGILCAFAKKTRNFASFTRGCCWVLGILLLSNISNTFRIITPWQYTFENAAISVTVPNRHWNTVSISTDKTIDIRSEDNSVFISAFRLPAGRSADGSLEELKKMQRDNLKDPVSYTHLDVYKRQERQREKGPPSVQRQSHRGLCGRYCGCFYACLLYTSC